ncbi:MAG: hypothetical protein WBD34_12315 [Burkholderiaceae bacterium]
MLTDIDMLAVRFGRQAADRMREKSGVTAKGIGGPVTIAVDPMLQCPETHIDMIVAEVKQGRAQINPATRRRQVLAAALARFGCCDSTEAAVLARTLLQRGQAENSRGHTVRMVIFASSGERAPRGWHWIHLDHVFRFLDTFLRSESKTLGKVDLHDPALNWLSLLHKCDLTLQKKALTP